MGYGTYSFADREVRAASAGYYTKSASQIFTQRQVHSLMNPTNVSLRESRDSQEHPNSIAIIFALDVTGSMGRIPHDMIRNGLPTIMGTLMQKGIADPQLMFLAVGDHECDDAPLQISQFETSDALLDNWLTKVWIEGGGGANRGESYSLAHYFAAYKTSIDCFEKRGQKGFLFTIGDEPTLNTYPASALKDIFGEGQYQNYSAEQLLVEAQKMYNVYHLHVREGSNGTNQGVMNGWSKLLGQNLIIIEDTKDIPSKIAEIVYSNVSIATISSVPEEVAHVPSFVAHEITSIPPVENHGMDSINML